MGIFYSISEHSGLLKRMNPPVEKNKFGIDALFTQGRPPRHNMTREMTPQPGI
jgi:hypothetical protein